MSLFKETINAIFYQDFSNNNKAKELMRDILRIFYSVIYALIKLYGNEIHQFLFL